MGLLCLIYLIAALRTNIAFVIVFACLVVAFPLLTGAYFLQAMDFAGNAVVVGKLVKVSLHLYQLRSTTRTNSNSTGCWCNGVHMLSHRLVDFPRAHARRRRLPP